MKNKILKKIDEFSFDAIEIAKKIHNNPELCYKETFSSYLLSEEIKKFDFKLKKPVANIETAFVAENINKKNGPIIGIIAEYDALPLIGHACGHNLIAGASFLACVGLSFFKSELPGILRFIGTPAEEGGGGKIKMIEKGVFDDIDFAMMFHPTSLNLIGRGSLAIKEIEFKFYGKESHASSTPHEGINALDGVISTFNNINALRQHIKQDSRIHGIITNGGEKPNIVPGFSSAIFYIRAKESKYLDELIEKVINCAKAGALSSGSKLEYNFLNAGYKNMKPNKYMCNLWTENMKQLNIELDEYSGGMGSTDMGDVSHIVKAIHPYLSIFEKNKNIPTHSKEFTIAANSKKAYETMINAAKLLAMTAFDIFIDKKVIGK